MIGRFITDFIDHRGSETEYENSHAIKLWRTFMPFRSYPYTQTDEEKEKDLVIERIYRHSWWKDKVVKEDKNVKLDTLWKCFKKVERDNGKFPCVRFRPIYDADHASGNLVWNYSQCYSIVSLLTKGLHCLGVQQGEVVSIISEAYLFDLFVMLSCSYAGYVLSTLDEGCTDVESRMRLLKQSKSRIVFTGVAHIDEVFKAIESNELELDFIIIFPMNAMLLENGLGNDKPSEIDVHRARECGVKIMLFTELMRRGDEYGDYRPADYNPESLGFLFWNDDSGEFKAIQHSHKSMAVMANMLSIESQITVKDIYFSCSSIGNIYEMNMISSVLFSGASVCIATFRRKDILNDIKFCSPTMLLLPEDTLNIILNEIKALRFSMPSAMGLIFDYALSRCDSSILYEQSFGFLERSCLNALRWYMGLSHVRIAGSPVSLLSPTLATFTKAFLCHNLVQGFGCPEVGGIALFSPGIDGNVNLWQCGQPLRHNMIKLQNETHPNVKPWGPLENMGELCIHSRGTMFLGYFQEKKPVPSWFSTSQVTRVNHDGSFTTMGGKEETFRYQFGFALKSFRVYEFFYSQLWEISQICIIYLPSQTYIAVIVPNAYWSREVCQELDPGVLTSPYWGKQLSKEMKKNEIDFKKRMMSNVSDLFSNKQRFEDACELKDIILETNISDTSCAFSRRNKCIQSNGELRRLEILKKYLDLILSDGNKLRGVVLRYKNDVEMVMSKVMKTMEK